MLITLKNILKMAESKDMAIAAFNVTSLEGVLAVKRRRMRIHP